MRKHKCSELLHAAQFGMEYVNKLFKEKKIKPKDRDIILNVCGMFFELQCKERSGLFYRQVKKYFAKGA